MTTYPLAHQSGIALLGHILTADGVWRSLTKPQRELLLSTAAGFPIRARRDVRQRLFNAGLISHPSYAGGVPELTDFAREVIRWRLP